MIKVHRLKGEEFSLNAEYIEFVEETPDTIISLTSGKKVYVAESMDEVIEMIIEYKRKVFSSKTIKGVN